MDGWDGGEVVVVWWWWRVAGGVKHSADRTLDVGREQSINSK